MKDIKKVIDDQQNCLNIKPTSLRDFCEKYYNCNYVSDQNALSKISFNVLNQYFDHRDKVMMSNVQDVIDKKTKDLADKITYDIKKWIIEEYTESIQKWIIEEYSNELQNWLCEEYGAEIQDLITDKINEFNNDQMDKLKLNEEISNLSNMFR